MPPIRRHASSLRIPCAALVALALLVGHRTAPALAAPTGVSTGVVISQIYGGGGNSGATLRNDFVELFNRGDVAVDLTGWTIQYASAAGSTWQTTALSGVVPPGGYYLVREAAGAGGTTDLPAPDAIGTIAMSATAGKVALVSAATALAGACPTDATIVDLVGYGGASCAEGSSAPTLGNTTAAIREADGCEETDDNAADFSEDAPQPRNSASPTRSCRYTLTVVVDPAGAGTVARAPDQADYLHGTGVTLTATPSPGMHFVHWSGDATGSVNPIALTLRADGVVTAHFEPNPPAGAISISQVYGGGGNTGATLRNDFIELFNRGNTAVDVTGWSVQYASHDGTTWTTTTLLGVIPPGRHYLIQEAQGAGGTTDLPTPDVVHDIAMHSESGKVALVRHALPLTGSCPSGPDVVDLVGYGGANCAETAPAATLSNPVAAHRHDGGCTDSGDNAADFASGAPTPRNSASPFHLCSFWVGVVPSEDAFSLGPVAPTPVRDRARIHFALARAAWVRLEVLDAQGRRLEVLEDGLFPAGRHERAWSPAARADRAGAVCFVRLRVAGESFVRRVVVLP